MAQAQTVGGREAVDIKVKGAEGILKSKWVLAYLLYFAYSPKIVWSP